MREAAAARVRDAEAAEAAETARAAATAVKRRLGRPKKLRVLSVEAAAQPPPPLSNAGEKGKRKTWRN